VTLAVDFVLLRELVAFGCIESVKFADCLRGKNFAIYQEKNFSDQLPEKGNRYSEKQKPRFDWLRRLEQVGQLR
jgi:hypothetical protein